MIKKEIFPRLKMDIFDYINDNFKYEEGNYMGIEACLSDHEVFRLDKKLNFENFGLDENPEYVMFLEKCKTGAFGPYQIWDFFAFSEDELEKVAKENGVFSYDELCCMEAFEHYPEDDDE